MSKPGEKPAEPAKPKLRFVVWPHGSVRHNEREYLPGAEIPISEEQASALGEAVIRVES